MQYDTVPRWNGTEASRARRRRRRRRAAAPAAAARRDGARASNVTHTINHFSKTSSNIRNIIKTNELLNSVFL